MLGTKRLSKLLIIIAIFISLGFTCPHKNAIIIQKKKIYQAKCPSRDKSVYSEYILEITSDQKLYNGRKILYRDEIGIFEKFEKIKDYLDTDTDYMFIDPYHYPMNWLQVRIFCAETKQLILDTGTVSAENAKCYQKESLFFFLDGHARSKNGDSCFPEGARVDGLFEMLNSGGE